ncbi:MAG TPA: hypothetical protein VFW96_00395 [Thermomicrobiales bacterium]|nr:hypothetical protein [Thermomicrobiales bacterium]
MSATTGDRLYALLPAIYRQRDAAQGEPLRALLAVIEGELGLVEDDIAGLYDNWFIETCAEWVVPYLGDLLTVRGLLPVTAAGGALSQRAIVANTLRYRRRKGTAAMLEQLARDVTGWPARAVEFFERLATTQHVNHPRLASPALVDLRDADGLELLGGPFERAAHIAEVRHVDANRGRYNIANVGLFVWRLQPYAVTRGDPRAVADPADGRYTFNPLGIDAPLFNRPRTVDETTQRAGEVNVPDPLRRRPLFDELEALRATPGAAPPPGVARYFADGAVLEVFRRGADGRLAPCPPAQLRVCHLGAWRRPAAADEVLVDPALGRLTVAAGAPAPEAVSYAYGYGGDLGGGPYDRRASVAAWFDPDADPGRRDRWQLGVTREPPAGDPRLVGTLAEAVAAWNALPSHRVERVALADGQEVDRVRRIDRLGLIAIMDSGGYAADLTGDLAITVPAGSTLALVAADWPAVPDPAAPGGRRREAGRLLPAEVRPHLRGDLAVRAAAPAATGLPPDIPPDEEQALAGPGDLILDGLLLEGTVGVLAGAPDPADEDRPASLGGLRIAHCTLVPGVRLDAAGAPRDPDRPSVAVDAANARLRVSLDHAITGPLALPAGITGLAVADSIVDSPPRRATPALVSGPLAAVALSAAAPAIDIAIGAEGPFRATFPAKPATLAEARDGLEAAIRAASGAPAFADARVITVPDADRLVVLPGVPGVVTIAGAGDDPTAAELRLDAAAARPVGALLGGALAAFAGLSAAAPALALTLGGDGPRLVALDTAAPSATPAQARERLQAAIRAAPGASAAFTAALVGRLDDRLVVLPGVAGAAALAAAAPADRRTVVELGLERARPAISGGPGGGLGFRPGPPATLERATVLGAAVLTELTLASETIFTAPPLIEKRQLGCVRFSYVPPGAGTPRRYRCQPDRETADRIAAAEARAAAAGGALTGAERVAIQAAVERAVVPLFTAARYGDPGYGQLAPGCPEPIRAGAEDEGELGAFHFLQQPRRLANLRANLDEYLRFGLEAGIFVVT